MENQDLDLIGQTVGSMPYKIGIVDKDGKLATQFVAKSSTNRIDIPQSSLGAGGSSTGGNTGSPVPQLPSTTNLFSGSVTLIHIFLSGVTPNYDNVQDGLLITLSQITTSCNNGHTRMDLSPIGLRTIKIPKEKLIVNSSFDISDQLSKYIGKSIQGQHYDNDNNDWAEDDITYDFNIASFGGTTIDVLPNATISMNLTVSVKGGGWEYDGLQIPVIRVNTYKN